MRKNKKDNKGKRQFKTFLRIYVGILALVTIVVCIILWGKLKNYQNKYDKSEKECNPDLYVENFLSDINEDTLRDCIEKYGINVTEGFNQIENHSSYFNSVIESNGVSFERSEKFRKALPVYDIFAGTTRIAVISLKADGKNDQFGFHKWTLKDMAFDTDKIEYKNIEITAPVGYTVIYNGKEVGQDFVKENGEVKKDVIAEKAVALGAVISDSVVYGIKNSFGEVNVTVKDEKGNEITPVINGNKYVFSTVDTVMPEDVKQRVLETIDSYILTIYSKKSFEESSKYIEYGSDAYAIISDVLASVAWGWKPETVDILEQTVTDYIAYSDNIFACSYYGKIYKFKEGSMESGEETFNYRLLFRKYDGQWYLNYFVIV